MFLERAEAAILEWRRRRQNNAEGALAALFLDLDGFKPVNDTYGHAAGDMLVKEVALRLVDATRPDDYVSRFGGDEFPVLCRGLRTAADAHAVADRIRATSLSLSTSALVTLLVGLAGVTPAVAASAAVVPIVGDATTFTTSPPTRRTRAGQPCPSGRP